MKIKLNKLLMLHDTLRTIIDDNLCTNSLFKFRLLGMLKSMENHIANFNTVRNDKIVEYGEKDENGNYKINPENKEAWENFISAINEIVDTEVEVTMEKLKIDCVFNAGVPSEYLIGLYDFMEE